MAWAAEMAGGPVDAVAVGPSPPPPHEAATIAPLRAQTTHPARPQRRRPPMAPPLERGPRKDDPVWEWSCGRAIRPTSRQPGARHRPEPVTRCPADATHALPAALRQRCDRRLDTWSVSVRPSPECVQDPPAVCCLDEVEEVDVVVGEHVHAGDSGADLRHTDVKRIAPSRSPMPAAVASSISSAVVSSISGARSGPARTPVSRVPDAGHTPCA